MIDYRRPARGLTTGGTLALNHKPVARGTGSRLIPGFRMSFTGLGRRSWDNDATSVSRMTGCMTERQCQDRSRLRSAHVKANMPRDLTRTWTCVGQWCGSDAHIDADPHQ
jgi:hypothetical protein